MSRFGRFTSEDIEGTHFAVWAPNAERLSVIGDFNGWQTDAHGLRPRAYGSGIWEGFIPGVGAGALYWYYFVSRLYRYQVEKADPFAQRAELSRKTASAVWSPEWDWRDAE